MKRTSLILWSLGLVAVRPTSAGTQGDYIVIDLGTLGGDESGATAINDWGQVVGYADTAEGSVHAFLWEAGRGMQDLGGLGRFRSMAHDINEEGQVVGWSSTVGSDWHAFLWEADRGMQDLGALGGGNSRARAINEKSQVVGFSGTFEGYAHAFLWEAGRGMQDLGTMGGDWSYAYAISDSGQVVGRARKTNGDWRAFFWVRGIGMQDLGTLGGNASGATDINRELQVVGDSLTADGEKHAFLWEVGKGMQDLGTLGGPYSEAHSVNEAGQIVGFSRGANGEDQAFLWDPETGMQNLNDLLPEDSGWELKQARDINVQGWIVGEGEPSKGGPRHAFLLIPTDADRQPDLWIQQGGHWLGDNEYNSSGKNQTARKKKAAGKPVSFRARLYNDGIETETFLIQGPPGDEDWTVKYYRGSKNVTAWVTRPQGWSRAHVPPGGMRAFRIEVTPSSGLNPGDVLKIKVRAASAQHPTQRDVIKAVTKVK